MEQKHILLVEDDASIAQSLIYTLEKAGFSIEHTILGRLGVNVALKTKPDLIIADLLLPDINGAEMIKEIRADSWGKTVKVIVLTNLDEEHMRSKLAPLNVSRYLLKVDNSLSQVTQIVQELTSDLVSSH